MGFATLTVDLNASIAKFEANLAQAVRLSQGAASKIDKAFGQLKSLAGLLGVGLSVSAFVGGIKSVVDAAQELGKASEKTGIAVESLAGLKLAAASVEVPFEALTAGLVKFNKALDEGNPAFQRLGFSLQQVQKFSREPAVGLAAVVDKLAAMDAGAAKSTITLKLFGKAGADLIPFINLGSKGFAEFAKQAERFGLALSKDSIRQLDLLDAKFDELAATSLGFKTTLVAALAPALNEVAAALLNIDKAAQSSAIQGLVELFKVLAVTGANVGYVFDQIGQDMAGMVLRMKAALHGDFKLAQDILDEMRVRADEARKSIDALSERIMHPPKPPPVDLGLPKKAAPGALTDPAAESARRKAELANIIAEQELSAEQQQTLLDAAHDRGLVSEKDYYNRRTQIVRESLGASLDAVNQAVKDEQTALSGADATKAAAVQVNIIRLLGQRSILEEKIGFEGTRSELDKAKAAQVLGDKITEMNASLLEQSGKLTAAAGLRFDAENRLNREILRRNAPANEEDLNKLRQIAVLKSSLNEVQRSQNLLLETQATVEARINNELTAAGNSPEAQAAALEKLNAARLASIAPLQKSADTALILARALGDKEAVANMERLKVELDGVAAASSGAAAAADKLAIAQQKTSLLLRDEAAQEQHIQNLRAGGAITSFQALLKTDEIRRKSIDTLTKMADEEERLAIASRDPSRLLAVKELRNEIEALAATSHQAADEISGVFEDSLTGGLAEFIDGTKNASDAFDDFAKSVERSLSRLAAQNIAESIFGGAGGGGKGGLIASLIGAFAGGGGSGGGGASYSGRMELGGIMTSLGQVNLNRYAGGGVAYGPQMAMFGEGKKPEAYVPLPDGRSIPVTVKGSSAAPVVVNVNVSTPDYASFRQSRAQIAREVQSSLAVARARA